MKSTNNIEFFTRDRRLSITREGADPARFEFDKSTRRTLRMEKRIYRRSLRRTGKAEIRAIVEEDEIDRLNAEAEARMDAAIEAEEARLRYESFLH